MLTHDIYTLPDAKQTDNNLKWSLMEVNWSSGIFLNKSKKKHKNEDCAATRIWSFILNSKLDLSVSNSTSLSLSKEN